MQKIKRKIISIKKRIFGLIFIFLISFGFTLPLNFSLNFDKNDRVYKGSRLQITNYSYCVEWSKIMDFSHYYVIGTDAEGNELRYYIHESARLISVSQDGEFIIAGGTTGYCSPGDTEGGAFILKLNNLGDYFWNISLGVWQGGLLKLFYDQNNNFYIGATETSGQTCDQFKFILHKYDKEGNLLYKTNGIENGDKQAFSMAKDTLGNIYIVGHKSGEVFISKYDQSCNLIWTNYYTKFFNNFSAEYTGEMANLADEFIIDIDTDSQDNIFGITKHFIIPESSLIKFNSYGNLLWKSNLSDCKRIRIDKNDNIYVLKDSELVRFDEDGNIIWQINTTSPLVELDADNNVYLRESNELIKLHTNGTKESLFFDNHICAFSIDSNANIYTAGIYNSNFIVKKYGIDTDHDNLTDWSESNIYYTDPNINDSDGDDLSDGAEIYIHLTDPNDQDSDDDGLNDGKEIDIYFTDPNDQDSDDDGLNDREEIEIYLTDPNDQDSDDDGYSDGEEIRNGYDPNNKLSNPLINYTSIIVSILIIGAIIIVMIILLKKKYSAIS